MIHLTLVAAPPVNPFLGIAGPIAAIIIGLYMVIFIVLSLALSALATFVAYWVRHKAEIIKMLRPTVVSVNQTTKAFQRGVPPEHVDNVLVRTVAQGASQVQKVDQQVTQVSDRVVGTAIEFRARMLQVEAVIKAFLPPTPRAITAAQGAPAIAPEAGRDSYKPVEQPTTASPTLTPVGGDGAAPVSRSAAPSTSTRRSNVPVH